MRETTMETEVVCFGRFGSSKSFVEYAALRATRCYASRSATRDAALRATTNPGAAKDRLCRSGGDLPPPGLRLPPSRDALRSRLAGVGASPPPIRASSPRRDTNAAFAAHEISRTGRTGHLLTFPPSHLPAFPPSHLSTFSPSVREAREAGVFVRGEGRLSCPAAGRNPKGGDGDFAAAEATPRSRPWNRRRQSPAGDSSCHRVRGRAQRNSIHKIL